MNRLIYIASNDIAYEKSTINCAKMQTAESKVDQTTEPTATLFTFLPVASLAAENMQKRTLGLHRVPSTVYNIKR